LIAALVRWKHAAAKRRLLDDILVILHEDAARLN
jgi:hypothetical protein